jgi:hypothetical protein
MLCISVLEFTSRSSSLVEFLSSNPASDLVGDLSEVSNLGTYCSIEAALDVDLEGG